MTEFYLSFQLSIFFSLKMKRTLWRKRFHNELEKTSQERTPFLSIWEKYQWPPWTPVRLHLRWSCYLDTFILFCYIEFMSTNWRKKSIEANLRHKCRSCFWSIEKEKISIYQYLCNCLSSQPINRTKLILRNQNIFSFEPYAVVIQRKGLSSAREETKLIVLHSRTKCIVTDKKVHAFIKGCAY